ncbi:unnamed protein product [Dibothriocephalus latus]|uniref:Endonuclease/exonuclease/phosphatase domain-containing protein n=1 Tax=Dibothriocephalus latus TaxID=60516 RepID=A0A3P7LE13_DIBLA|nr:unnamed protein product [Dibothriocephalus latus]
MRTAQLNRNQTLGIGSCNVRTSRAPGTQSLTVHNLYQYNVDVCCLSDFLTQGIIISGVNSHFALYHSGPHDSSGKHGVAIALSQKASRALLAWRPVTERMVYVRLKGHFTNISVVHRNKRLLTWYSNDGHTASEIDYILVNSRFRRWVHDSRSLRGAETGNAHGSDHVLAPPRLKAHLSSAPKMSRVRRLDVAKIRQTNTA